MLRTWVPAAILIIASAASGQCPRPDLTGDALVSFAADSPEGDIDAVLRFGRDVSISGARAAVGTDIREVNELNSDGAIALLYDYPGGWAPAGIIRHPFGSGFDGGFGDQVELDGDWLVVAAAADVQQNFFGGAVVFYRRQGGQWVETQQFRPSDQFEDQSFGDQIELAGDVLIVGADENFSQTQGAGSVYILTRSGGTWSQASKLTPGAPLEAFSGFGSRVATDGRRAAAFRYEDPQGSTQTVIDVYDRGSGWTLETTLRFPADLDPNPAFVSGESLQIRGRYLLAGMRSTLGPRVLVWERDDATGWVFRQVLAPDDIVEPGVSITFQFADSIALDGNVAAVSFNDNRTGRPGYRLYTNVDGTWTPSGQRQHTATNFSNSIGESLELDGDRVILGNPDDESSGSFVYTGSIVATDVGDEMPIASGAAVSEFTITLEVNGASVEITLPLAVTGAVRTTGCGQADTLGVSRLRLEVPDGVVIDAAQFGSLPVPLEEIFGVPVDADQPVTARLNGISLGYSRSGDGGSPSHAALDPFAPTQSLDLQDMVLGWSGSVDLSMGGMTINVPLDGQFLPPIDLTVDLSTPADGSQPLAAQLGGAVGLDFTTTGGDAGRISLGGQADVEVVPACAQDVDGNGRTDFFDTLAFLAGYDAQEPASDIAAAFGTLDAVDVELHLDQAANGCP